MPNILVRRKQDTFFMKEFYYKWRCRSIIRVVLLRQRFDSNNWFEIQNFLGEINPFVNLFQIESILFKIEILSATQFVRLLCLSKTCYSLLMYKKQMMMQWDENPREMMQLMK